jgi:hypothetical protein
MRGSRCGDLTDPYASHPLLEFLLPYPAKCSVCRRQEVIVADVRRLFESLSRISPGSDALCALMEKRMIPYSSYMRFAVSVSAHQRKTVSSHAAIVDCAAIRHSQSFRTLEHCSLTRHNITLTFNTPCCSVRLCACYCCLIPSHLLNLREKVETYTYARIHTQ